MTGVTVVTDTNGENMEPSYDDVADTLTATLRTMRDLTTKLDAVLQAIFALSGAVGIILGLAAIYTLREVYNRG